MPVDVFSHPWLGGLFGDEEIAALLGSDHMLESMRETEAAYARALGKAGVVSQKISGAAADHILSANISLEGLRAGTGTDGLVVPELIRQLKQSADPNLHPAIHVGLTSQDVMDTAMVLSLFSLIGVFEQRLDRLIKALAYLQGKFGDRTMTGRTRMQFAKDIRVHDRIRTWVNPLETHCQTLEQIKPRLLQLQLGGAVGNRGELGEQSKAIASDMAKSLGLGNPETGWHTERGAIVEFSGWLSMVSGTLGKMGQDISLMAQQGIDEIQMTGGGGSSAMPHKQNPIAGELLVTLARFNATLVSGMHQSMVHEQERSGVAWALEWMLLPQMLMATGRGMTVANEICAKITEMGTE